MERTSQLIDLIALEQQDEDRFQGMSSFMGSPHVFGGQVVAQALHAAARTVPVERICHSLHSYFILPGNLKLPIVYQVQRIRDGGSFMTRYITAIQEDKPIFIMIASFHKHEPGHQHQVDMPVVPEPESLSTWIEVPASAPFDVQERMRRFIGVERPIEMRSCLPSGTPSAGEVQGMFSNPVWFRFKEAPAQLDWTTVQQLIAYASDYNILTTAMRPHRLKANYANTHVASLDHAMWFHHRTDLQDWLLFDCISPIAAHARGYATGRIFDRQGQLVASVSQEGLMRPLST